MNYLVLIIITLIPCTSARSLKKQPQRNKSSCHSHDLISGPDRAGWDNTFSFSHFDSKQLHHEKELASPVGGARHPLWTWSVRACQDEAQICVHRLLAFREIAR